MTGRRLRVLDLFAGAGGMTRGFLDARGFRVVGAVESDPQAAATYAVNFGESNVVCGDIALFSDVPSSDVVIGGPPCQGFSNLGSKNPDDPRNTLFREFVRVVSASGASVFVFENVNRFAASAEASLLQEETRPGGDLEGFELQTFMMNAADYGAAQKRRRVVIVGSRIGAIDAPLQTHFRTPQGRQRRWRTVRDAFRETQLPTSPNGTQLPPRSSQVFGRSVPGAFELAELHVGRTYQEKSLERYKLIRPGQSRHALPDHLQYECWRKLGQRGASDVLGRLLWDEPSVTVRTEFFKPEKGRFLHPEWSLNGLSQDRALTHAEAAVLQGFDQRHKWCGNKVGIARQIGNAVPPLMARAIALPVKQVFRSSEAQGRAQ